MCWGKNEFGRTLGPDGWVVPIQAVYLVPQGKSPVPSRAEAIADVVEEAQGWFRSQTGGRHPLFARDGDSISVKTIRLDRPLSSFADDSHGSATRYLAGHVRGVLGLGETVPLLIVAEATYYYDEEEDYCAWESFPVIVFPLGNCSYSPEIGSTWPYGGSRTIAHELTHLLGAVPECAPNHIPSNGAHVDDDISDIIFHKGTDWENIVLDFGNDDYYLHGRADCYDIDRNPLLAYE